MKDENNFRGKSKITHPENSASHQANATSKTAAPTTPSKGVVQATKSQGQPQGHTRDITCFKCKGRGHYAKECPNQRVMHIGNDGLWYSEEEEEKMEEHCPETFLGFSDEEGDQEGAKDDATHSLVVLKSFDKVYNHRETPFHMQSKVLHKICLTMVDGGSCTNVVARSLVEELQLPKIPHPQPYKLRWLGNFGEVKVVFQCLVPLIVGAYQENVLCDILPMDACHVLLGRPWEFDSNALRDCRTNEYVLRCGEGNVRLRPLAPHLAQRAHEKLLREQRERENPNLVKVEHKEKATKNELKNCYPNQASSSALSFALLGTKVVLHSKAKSQVQGACLDKVGVLDSRKNPFREGGNDVESYSIMITSGPQEHVKKLARKKRRRRRKTRNTIPGNPASRSRGTRGTPAPPGISRTEGILGPRPLQEIPQPAQHLAGNPAAPHSILQEIPQPAQHLAGNPAAPHSTLQEIPQLPHFPAQSSNFQQGSALFIH